MEREILSLSGRSSKKKKKNQRKNTHLVGEMREINATHFSFVPYGFVKSFGLFYMFSVSFSNSLNSEKAEEFKFRKKDSRILRLHFIFFTSNCAMPQWGKKGKLHISLGHRKCHLNNSKGELE